MHTTHIIHTTRSPVVRRRGAVQPLASIAGLVSRGEAFAGRFTDARGLLRMLRPYVSTTINVLDSR